MAFLPFAKPDITDREIEAVAQTMRSGWLTTGPVTSAFEGEFLEFLQLDGHAVAVNSATSGLHLAFEAIGVREGTEVLVPTWTFTATAEAVRYLGGDPILVDADPATLCIDLEDAERKVSERTVAIAPVHFAGLAVPDSALTRFAAKHDIHVIEDAAHALPTINEGRLVGTHGHSATVYSFYATKTMTTGEGGMVVTQNEALAARMRTMRLHGINRDVFDRYTSTKPAWYYEVIAPGYKYNMTDVAAAIGRVQLSRIPEMTARRTKIAERYNEAFRDLPADLPAEAPVGSSHAWHLYVLRLGPDSPVDRDTFIEEMTRQSVGTSVHFIPLHLQPYWRDTYNLHPSDFPVASSEFSRAVSLPIFSSMSDHDVEKVVTATRNILGG